MHADTEAFTVAFRAHHATLVRYFVRRIGVRADADELASDVMRAAWSNAHITRFDLPWLYGIARNVLSEYHRKQTRHPATVPLLDADVTVAQPLEHSEALAPVIAALRTLAFKDQEVLMLNYWEELPPARIALVINVSPTAARVRLHRARRRLKQSLAQRNNQGER